MLFYESVRILISAKKVFDMFNNKFLFLCEILFN